MKAGKVGEWEGRERRNEGSETKEMELDEVKEGEKVVEEEREVEEMGGGSEAGNEGENEIEEGEENEKEEEEGVRSGCEWAEEVEVELGEELEEYGGKQGGWGEKKN